MRTWLEQNQVSVTRDLQDTEREMGYPTFTWNNATYGCVPVNLKRMEELKKGAFDVDIPLKMTVRKWFYDSDTDLLNSLFTDDPQLDDTVIQDGTKYFIKTITTDGTGTFYRMELKRKKNA